MISQQQNDWDDYLPYVLAAYRMTPIPELGVSPYELMYGWKAPIPLLAQLEKEKEWDLRKDWQERLNSLKRSQHSHIKMHKNKQDMRNGINGIK